MLFKIKFWLDLYQVHLKMLFRGRRDPEARNRSILLLIGTLLFPITLAGMLWGYIRAYNVFDRSTEEAPQLSKLSTLTKVSMAIGGIMIWLFIIAFIGAIWVAWKIFDWSPNVMLAYVGGNLVLSFVVYAVFSGWRTRTNNQLFEQNKFGSARFARPNDLSEYTDPNGFYIGGGYRFTDKGHILTVAGTRGGKGTNLIIPNLLGYGGYQGSWVVIDPKGENAAITTRYQAENGNKVVVLNPWGLLADNIGKSQSYNPLDLLVDKSSIHLVDDVQIIAEMLIPVTKDDNNKFFTDNARSIVAGLIMQIAVTQTGKDRTLATLWKWARYVGDEWHDLIAEMRLSDDPVNGEIIRNAGNEIMKLTAAGEETFGSIISTVLQCTDFLKSPVLQKSMETGFNPYDLADGKTSLYIIIPADKLQSHSRWLRLIVTTTLRAVIRKPNKRVCFLLDEFAALGYLPEIETALSTYAGYEVTVWPILQSLIQLKNLYGENWETFIANSTIRQYFSVNDNFTAEYVSKAIGDTSNIARNTKWFAADNTGANARALITPDELRRASGEHIFAFFGSKPPTYFKKMPYYKIEALENRSNKNPYIALSAKYVQ